MAQVRLHIRFGFWDRAAQALSELAANDTLQSSFAGSYTKGLLAYAQGMDALDRGAVDEAEKRHQRIDNITWSFAFGAPGRGDRYYARRRVNYLNVLANDLQAHIHSVRGEHEHALSKMEKAQKAAEKLPYEEPPEFARPLYESLGQIYLRADDWEEARDAFDRALEKRPQSGHVLLGLGRAYELGGENQKALATYEQALAAWRHADVDLPQLTQLRERIAALSP